jgi:hypothetical protein
MCKTCSLSRRHLGISYDISKSKTGWQQCYWRAQVRVGKKSRTLGRVRAEVVDAEEQAAVLYDLAVVELIGMAAFAGNFLNFPNGRP